MESLTTESRTYLPEVSKKLGKVDENDDPGDGKGGDQGRLELADHRNVVAPMQNVIEPIILSRIPAGPMNLY